jgi:hypothetical protein
MAFNYYVKDQGAVYFVTFTVHQWADVFTRTEYKQLESININNVGIYILCSISVAFIYNQPVFILSIFDY